ncbi:MAG TPA: type II toxin-antitoxin system VapC family toxin [Dehalococcoidia bacterium]|nr:type II toxin-antitoxin system VapC family toxin [Dehalococcoidia bacterium]
MAANFWDTSALVKLYVAEAGSEQARGLAVSDDIGVSAITAVEFASALRRRTVIGDLSPDQSGALYRRFLADVAGFDVVELSETVRREAVRLMLGEPRITGRLRGLDAIQLATAVVWFEAPRAPNMQPGAFIVADHALREAAVTLGLVVLNPEDDV